MTHRVAVTTARPAQVVDPRGACLVCASHERQCTFRFERPWPFDSSSRVVPLTAVAADGRCQAVALDKKEARRRDAVHFDLAAKQPRERDHCLLPHAFDAAVSLERCEDKRRRELALARGGGDRGGGTSGAFTDRSGMSGLAAIGALATLVPPVVAAVVPRYIVNFGPDRSAHGLLWEVAVETRTGKHGFGHTFAASLAWFPDPGSVAGRAAYRLWPLFREVFQLAAGLGAVVDAERFGPTLEARVRLSPLQPELGHLGLYVGAGYEPDLRSGRHVGLFTAGLEAPWPLDKR